MHKLCELESPALAAGVLARLEEASIPATITHTHNAGLIQPFRSWRGAPTSIIWIADEEDLPEAERLLDLVRSAPMAADRCPGCGYDLAGHDEAGACPECGGTIVPPVEDVICEDCGEPGPADFESCWNCGSANPEREHPASTVPSVAAEPAGLSFPWRLVLLGGMVWFGLGIVMSALRRCA